MLCKKTMGAGDREFLIYLLIYSNKLAYLQLITVLVYRSSPPKSWARLLKLCENLEKYVWMHSFLEPATLLKII